MLRGVPAVLTAEQLDQFDRDGFLVIEGVFGSCELEEVHAEYTRILDRIAPQLVASGKLTREYTGLGFGERYTAMIGEVEEMYDVYQHLDISIPLQESLSPGTKMSAGPAVFALLTNPELLDIVETIVGQEILANPTQHTRLKPPTLQLPEVVTDTIIARTTWHQDFAFLDPTAYETKMVTVWIAVTDARIENGCLYAIRGSHKHGLTLHCPGKDYPGELYIPDVLIDRTRAVPLEIGAGGVVLFSGFTVHGSGDNNSASIRWSFDLRYQPADQPTGRAFFPACLVRSTSDPGSVIIDADDWARVWYEARDRVASGEVRIPSRDLLAENSAHSLCG